MSFRKLSSVVILLHCTLAHALQVNAALARTRSGVGRAQQAGEQNALARSLSGVREEEQGKEHEDGEVKHDDGLNVLMRTASANPYDRGHGGENTLAVARSHDPEHDAKNSSPDHGLGGEMFEEIDVSEAVGAPESAKPPAAAAVSVTQFNGDGDWQLVLPGISADQSGCGDPDASVMPADPSLDSSAQQMFGHPFSFAATDPPASDDVGSELNNKTHIFFDSNDRFCSFLTQSIHKSVDFVNFFLIFFLFPDI